MLYTVEYDLIDQRNYTNLIEAIKTYPDWVRVLRSSWIIKSSSSSQSILEHLKSKIDSDDKLIVIELKTPTSCWSTNLSSEVIAWLKINL